MRQFKVPVSSKPDWTLCWVRVRKLAT